MIRKLRSGGYRLYSRRPAGGAISAGDSGSQITHGGIATVIQYELRMTRSDQPADFI